jgi:hypothetical protein
MIAKGMDMTVSRRIGHSLGSSEHLFDDGDSKAGSVVEVAFR